MIEIKEKENCCGCEACVNICPHNCIKMVEDEEGFRYPVIDKEKCINCGACNKVCPMIEEPDKKSLKDSLFYAAYNRNDEDLKNSSSGGIFFLLAREILNDNGTVYGVIQDSTYDVHFERATTLEECKKMRGSKYLQANVNETYKNVKKDLLSGKSVLFSGTPCQVAALYKFLNKNYEKLFTVDVVCHGVPSNRVYRKFIKYKEEKNNSKVVNIKWRDKVHGWGPNRITLFFDNGKKLTTMSRQNEFQLGFLNNLYLRNSCYVCKYAKLPRIGDISLADFWGYTGKLETTNENKGLSAVIVSSNKGEQLFEKIKGYIYYHSVDKEFITSRSRHVYTHPLENKKRNDFFKDLDDMNFNSLCRKYHMKDSKIKNFMLPLKKKIKIILKRK